ncbi:MAG TPA: SdpI family protein, partial [Chitinophagaceae bacterium]|nr:SdpI family protein [Chitinophagaceae bacterium]
SSSPAGFARLGMVILVFISLLNLVIIISCSSPGHAPLKLMPSLIGLLFAFTGNYMSSIKPNYFAGIRLPWTLNSESNWKKTHHLGGKLWFWGGLTMAVVCLFIPEKAGIPTLLVTMLILTIIPAVYSFYLFTKEKNTQS